MEYPKLAGWFAGKIPILIFQIKHPCIGLLGKIYRKPWFFPWNMGLSCKFSHKNIHFVWEFPGHVSSSEGGRPGSRPPARDGLWWEESRASTAEILCPMLKREDICHNDSQCNIYILYYIYYIYIIYIYYIIYII